MSLFTVTDYRDYLRSHLKSLPKEGWGELSRIAQHLKVNTTLISQIMGGTREFSVEQALELSNFLGHGPLETEYFSLLVQLERAGTQALKDYLRTKLASVSKEALQLSKRVSHARTLSLQQRSKFYSSWIYSAVHLFTSIRSQGTRIDEVATRFDLTRPKALEILQFLLQAGLIIETDGVYTIGVLSTFLEKQSPELLKHHSNWRIQAINKSESLDDSELMFTGQVSLSRADFERVREQIAEFIKTVATVAKDSSAEEIACLNIDWFWI